MNNTKKLFDVDGIHMLGNFDNGAVIGLDDEGFAYLSHDDSKLCPSYKRAEIDEARQELGFLEDKVEPKINAAYIHVIDCCNLHCVGCYSFIENRNATPSLSLNAVKQILINLKKAGVRQLVVSGGEPFIRDDLHEICKYSREHCGFEFITVITNGTMNMEKYYSVIPYINQLNISIDGYSEDTCFIRDKGIMPSVLNTIRTLKNHIDINMIVTLHKKNMNFMKEYNELANKLGVMYSYSIFTVDESNPLFREYVLTDADLLTIEKTLMSLNIEASIADIPIGGEAILCRSRCEAGNKLISVDAKGNVYPCHMLHKAEFLLGNALEKEITDIIFSKSNPFQNIHVDNFESCCKCNYKYLCGGGCRGRSYLRYGNINKKDSYCTMIYNYYKDLMKEVKKSLGGVA